MPGDHSPTDVPHQRVLRLAVALHHILGQEYIERLFRALSLVVSIGEDRHEVVRRVGVRSLEDGSEVASGQPVARQLVAGEEALIAHLHPHLIADHAPEAEARLTVFAKETIQVGVAATVNPPVIPLHKL